MRKYGSSFPEGSKYKRVPKYNELDRSVKPKHMRKLFAVPPIIDSFLDNDGNPTIMVIVKSMRNIISYPATNAQ